MAATVLFYINLFICKTHLIISDMRRNTTQKPDFLRDKYKCKVPGCDAELISDKVKLHYERRVCKDISSKLNDMIQQSPYQEQVTNAFGAIHDFQVSAADFQKALDMLESLVNTFPDKDKNSFNLNLALSGFVD